MKIWLLRTRKADKSKFVTLKSVFKPVKKRVAASKRRLINKNR